VTASAARDLPREQLMSIGEVLARLRPEFPDVTISKLRFLEAEGLVEPRRAPSGYRKYTAEHLQRLRYVLAAQRDRYLPLRVIREDLAALDRGERILGLPAQPAAATDLAPALLTREQLADRADVSAEDLDTLEQYGLLAAGPDGLFDAEALTVARLAGQLAEYGLHARHLRPYRAAADREVGLLAQAVAPMARSEAAGGRAQAIQTVHELAALCAQLHAALVRVGLRKTVGG
jgi:DNA-binding transcriptional MerR regulator